MQLRFWAGILACGVACSSGKDDHGTVIDDTGGSSNTSGTRNNRAGSSSQNEAGAPSDAGGAPLAEGGAGGDSAVIYEGAGAPPEAPLPVCKPELTLGTAENEDIGKPEPELLSMTPDELSVVFSAADTFYVADRASTHDAFLATSVTLPDGFEAKSGAALTKDGLHVIVVMSDHSGFGQLTRASRSGAFLADAEVAPFAKLNGLKLTTGQSLGFPVLSQDGDFYYLSYFGQGLVHQTRLGKDGTYDLGLPIDEFTLGGNEGEYKLISAVSADQRAIFYFDQKSKHAMALFRSRPGSPFYNPVDLGERRGATPNADCTRVYSSSASGLVVQTTQ